MIFAKAITTVPSTAWKCFLTMRSDKQREMTGMQRVLTFLHFPMPRQRIFCGSLPSRYSSIPTVRSLLRCCLSFCLCCRGKDDSTFTRLETGSRQSNIIAVCQPRRPRTSTHTDLDSSGDLYQWPSNTGVFEWNICRRFWRELGCTMRAR